MTRVHLFIALLKKLCLFHYFHSFFVLQGYDILAVNNNLESNVHQILTFLFDYI